jgi:hypothetical protein
MDIGSEELDGFMYMETLLCLEQIDTSLPEYANLCGLDMLQYCSESMADIADAVDHGFSAEAAYRVAGTLLERYTLVSALSMDQCEVSFHLYNAMLALRKETRELQFDTWIGRWSQHVENGDMVVEDEDDDEGDDDEGDDEDMDGLMEYEQPMGDDGPVLLPGVNAFDESVLAGLTVAESY